MSDVVMVTGVGGPAGVAAVTWFRGRGSRVIGADMRELAPAGNGFHRVPAADDPRFELSLLDLVARERPTLLVPTVTEELPIVARLREALASRGCAVAISRPPAVDIVNDKLATADELGRLGIPVPVTIPGPAAHADLVARLGLPYLSKPRFGRGGRGVALHEAPAQGDGAGPGGIVYQEFIPGEEYDGNLYVARGGEVRAAVVLRKTSLKEGRVGNALGTERAEHPGVHDLCLRVARVLELTGPLDMDVRLRSDGSPVLLEVNARIGANVLSAPEVMEALFEDWRNGRCA